MVTAGCAHSACLTNRGRIVCWGRNDAGQCNVPKLPPGEVFTMVSAGMAHTMGLTSSGLILAWGSNDRGQLDVPKLSVGEFWTMVAAGNAHSAALKSSGHIVAWGHDYSGQCSTVTGPPKNTSFKMVSAGGSMTCGLTTTGEVVVWGSKIGEIPREVFTSISAGGGHITGVTKDGMIKVWGSNSAGQCLAHPPLKAGEVFTKVCAGGCHTLGLTSTGRILAWGSSSSGQARNPQISDDRHFTAIAAGGSPPQDGHSLGLTNKGTIEGWGCTDNGRCVAPALAHGEEYVEADVQQRMVVQLIGCLSGNHLTVDCRSLGGERLACFSLDIAVSTAAQVSELLRSHLPMPHQAVLPSGCLLAHVDTGESALSIFGLDAKCETSSVEINKTIVEI